MRKTQNLNDELELQGDQRQPAMHEYGGLVITTEIAQAFIKHIIVIEGLEAARNVYKQFGGFFAIFKEWSGIAQAINELLEQEAERKRKLLSILNKKPAIINYGPYYEIQAGGNCYTNQGMEGPVNEDEICEEGDNGGGHTEEKMEKKPPELYSSSN